MKDTLDARSMLQLYYALVYSHIAYNVILWGNAKTANRVLIAQKRIIRLLFKVDYQKSCKPTFKNKKKMTLTSLFIYRSILTIWKYKSNKQIEHNTRNNYTIFYEKHRSALYEKSPMYESKRLFNNLPLKIRKCDNYIVFKSEVKTLLYLNLLCK